jgi:hypothetical protein
MEPNGNRTIVSTEAKRLAGRCGRNDFQPLKSSIEKVESRSQDWKKVTGHFLKVKSRDLKLRLGRLADWPCEPCMHMPGLRLQIPVRPAGLEMRVAGGAYALLSHSATRSQPRDHEPRLQTTTHGCVMHGGGSVLCCFFGSRTSCRPRLHLLTASGFVLLARKRTTDM